MKTISTLRTMLLKTLDRSSGKIALIEGSRRYTYREFVDRVNRMSNALISLGLKKGERVGIISFNSIEGCESYFSISNAGLVMVMLNYRLAPLEMLTILKDAEVSALMISEDFINHYKEISRELNFIKYFIYIGDKDHTPTNFYFYEDMIKKSSGDFPNIEIFEDDLTALMYTSGTTGTPKGCMVTHLNFYHAGRCLTTELKMVEDDFNIIASPLFHATGEVTLLNAVYSGTGSVVMPKFDPDLFFQLVDKYKVTTGMLATPMLQFIVDYPNRDNYSLSSLKKVFFAGAGVKVAVYKKAIEKFGNIFIHLFGTTETVGTTNLLKLEWIDEHLKKGNIKILGSVGKSAVDTVTVVVDDNDNPVAPGEIGEIKIKSLGNTLGYWKKEDETKKVYRNGWYYPLDLCKVDEDGFIYIVDRKKDMIITGGENVYPTEVENILYMHKDISQAAVVGLPDETWGEIVAAAVVKREGSLITDNDIKNFCRNYIAGYKIPKKIIFRESLPLNASGKILKFKLRDELKSSI